MLQPPDSNQLKGYRVGPLRRPARGVQGPRAPGPHAAHRPDEAWQAKENTDRFLSALLAGQGAFKNISKQMLIFPFSGVAYFEHPKNEKFRFSALLWMLGALGEYIQNAGESFFRSRFKTLKCTPDFQSIDLFFRNHSILQV